jgi:hypothetical protein
MLNKEDIENTKHKAFYETTGFRKKTSKLKMDILFVFLYTVLNTDISWVNLPL